MAGKSTNVFIAAAMTIALTCCTFDGSPPADPAGLTEPLVETATPFSDMVRITLPPRQPVDRADALARMTCGQGSFPILHSASDRRFTYRCIMNHPF